MKKLIATLAAVAGAAAMLAMTSPTTHAATAPALDAAIHISDFGCGMRDGDGGALAADKSSVVITSSGNGNLSCKARGVANSTGKAVHYNFANTGALCGTINGLTEDWSETVSASGNATLTCHTQP